MGLGSLDPTVLGGEQAWAKFPEVRRLLDDINQRPAVAAVERLRSRFSFKTEWDDEARRHMFPQLARLATPQGR